MGTQTLSYTFDASAQGWAWTQTTASGSSPTAGWASSGGDPGGCLSVSESGSSLPSIDGYWSLSGTWQSFGVPAGATVTDVQLSHVAESASVPTNATAAAGPYNLAGSGSGAVTLLGSLSYGAGSAAWASRSGPSVAVPADLQPAGSTVTLELGTSLGGSSAYGTVTVLQDDVTIVVTYSGGGSNASGSLAARKHPTLTAQAATHHLSGSASLSKHPTLAASGRDLHEGGVVAVRKHPALAASGRVVGPAVGSAALARHPRLAASGRVRPPSFVGAMVASHRGAFAAAGSSPGTSRSGVAHARKRGAIDAAGSATIPQFTGHAALAPEHPTLRAYDPASRPVALAWPFRAPRLAVARPAVVAWPFRPSRLPIPPRVAGSAALSHRGFAAALGGSNARAAALSLAISGSAYDAAVATTTLHVAGMTGTLAEAMNLVVATDRGPKAAATLGLVVASYPAGHVPAAMTLAIAGWNAPMAEAMNLVVRGGDWGAASEAMNLVVVGGNPTATGTLSLATYSAPPVSSWLPLAVAGRGINPGYIPIDEPMNLAIARGPQAGMTLFVRNSQVAGGITLAIAGQPVASEVCDLVVAGLGGTLTASADLAVVGADFAPISATADLSLPHAIGAAAASAPLFVGGFRSYIPA